MISLILEFIRKYREQLRRNKETSLRVEKYKSPIIGTDIEYRNRTRE